MVKIDVLGCKAILQTPIDTLRCTPPIAHKARPPMHFARPLPCTDRTHVRSLCLPCPWPAPTLMITWPGGWEVQAVPPAPDDSGVRQRAVKNDASGDPQMVMELTQSTLAPEHKVNMDAVLLQMRKTLQQNFAKGGYQSACNKIHDEHAGRPQGTATTCKITQNGNHVITQTLVAATREATMPTPCPTPAPQRATRPTKPRSMAFAPACA
jgi:hypothetical protein